MTSGRQSAMPSAMPRDPWRLGALNAITTLTGSAVIALAVLAGRLSPAEAWAAAHVDEDWNMEFWGRDELALKRRAYRYDEMTAAATVLAEVSEVPSRQVGGVPTSLLDFKSGA